MLSIQDLEPLFQRRPNAFLLQLFFDAKVEEIVNLFQEGPKIDFKKTEDVLKKIAPFLEVDGNKSKHNFVYFCFKKNQFAYQIKNKKLCHN